MQNRLCKGSEIRKLSTIFSVIRTISPGSISLIYSAPMISRAHVSDVRIYELLSFPRIKGRTPSGSLIPIIILSTRATSAYAPSI